MKSIIASLFLASVSPIAIAQHGLQVDTPDETSEAVEEMMAGDPVGAPLPEEVEKAILDDWFEAEFDGEIHPSVTKAARRAYTQTMFKPIWTKDGAASLQEASRDLFTYGLTPDDVLESSLNQLVDQRFSGSSDAERAKADLGLTAAWLRLASAISGGLATDGEAEASRRSAATYGLLPERLIEAGQQDGEMTFEVFESSYPQYDRLKKALLDYRGLREAGGWLAIPEGDTIEPGNSDPRVPALRDRLAAEGYLDSGKETETAMAAPGFGTRSDVERAGQENDRVGNGVIDESGEDGEPDNRRDMEPAETLYNDKLVRSVEAFQKRHGIKVDGLVGPGTLQALNESVESKIARIAGSMERWRQQGPADDRYVWVNIPSYRAEGWEDDERQITTKAIVGTAANQTPVFNDQVEYVVANPKWYMPVSILKNEKVPKLRRDPGYAQRSNFSVINRSTGEAVSAYSVNWNDPSVASKYRLVQQPGSSNALGELKIIFPNQYSVYLHGTPGEHLFDRAKRAFSHGCVRLEKPVQMAEWLAEMGHEVQPDTVEQAVEEDNHERFNFDHRVPVHITYMTVTVDEDGKASFWRDIYDRTEGVKQVEKFASVGRDTSAESTRLQKERG